jgi:hypothetical protein
MSSDFENARRLYAPSAASMQENLPAMGDSLSATCLDLSRDCSLDRLDQLAARLKAAQTSLIHLRKALVQECD